MPMGDYADFQDCLDKNSEKEDPHAYCGAIKHQVEGKELSETEKQILNPTVEQRIDSLARMVKNIAGKIGELFTLPKPAPSMDPREVKVEPLKVEPRTSSFTLTKDAKGEMRWFGFVSGNFKDRDKEVFPSEVHQEYVDFLDATKQYPELWVWHTPDSRFGKADWAEFEHGFLLMSGTVDKGKEAIAEAVASMPDQGMSHGFKFRYREPGVIGFYRTYEVSVLPLTHAAFPWTKIEIQNKEMSMKPEKRAYLESVLGKEKVDQIVSQADTLQKSLVAAGIDWKDFDPVPPEPPAPQPVDLIAAFKETAEYKALAAIPDALVRLAKDHADVTAIFDASIKALQDENKALKEQVAQKQDDVLRGLLTRRAHTPAAPASKSKDNLLDPAKDKDLAQAEPKLPVAAGLVASIIGKM